MKARTSHYPIGVLLLNVLKDSKLSLEPFVRAIGYGNPSKGIRAFDHIITFGEPVSVFLDRLNSSPFAPDPAALTHALEESKILVEKRLHAEALARQEEEERAFRPFVQGIPEHTTPTSISLFCLTGGHSRYTLPVPESLPTWDLVKQNRYVKELIEEHYSSCNGRTLYMGKITGYRLFRRYGEPAVVYTTTGQPLGLHSASPLPDGELSIAGKVVKPAQFRLETRVDEESE